MSEARYDALGGGYANQRRADGRLLALVEAALGDAVSLVNVGAGAGSYESPRRKVLAIDPSEVMLAQRATDAAPAIIGGAEKLPLLNGSVDAATAFFTVHHWGDPPAGLRELRRVARHNVVVMTYLPGAIEPTARWLTHEYFPAVAALDDKIFPTRAVYEQTLGGCEFQPVLIPTDCTDGFMDAYWSRPERYLEASVRASMSGFRLISASDVESGVERLRAELASGAWDERHHTLRTQPTYDAGLRLVVSRR